MDQLYMLRAFVEAVQHKSFSKAATSLGLTTGSISNRHHQTRGRASDACPASEHEVGDSHGGGTSLLPELLSAA